ncbi:Sensor histidine kinase CitA [Raoultella terrigena]|uniref:Sensor histidine kinase CitA n=1 Tax=Raoultella terrigena TaxID=577 RepID=A0A4U9D8G9_RAOTE|nr:Sensor histidine kinase CitA [Raoultella terrigena]
MGHYDEAIRYIQAQSEHAQELLDFISSRFSSPTLCGLLLGKAARAREKGVELSFDPACHIDRPLPSLIESELISIIGNLLDNAIEATQRAELPHEPVEVLIQLNARELMIEVADRGVGIRPEIRERIFERGVTTKTVAITASACILLNTMSLRLAAPSRLPITRRAGPSLRCLFPPTVRPTRHKGHTMHHDLVDVLIVEDESELARLHAELIQKHPRMRLAGMAASLTQARQMLNASPPQLVLLDNYLPDGKG